MEQQKVCVALAENLGLVPSTHVVAVGGTAYMYFTDIHAGKILIHIKEK